MTDTIDRSIKILNDSISSLLVYNTIENSTGILRADYKNLTGIEESWLTFQSLTDRRPVIPR